MQLVSAALITLTALGPIINGRQGVGTSLIARFDHRLSETPSPLLLALNGLIFTETYPSLLGIFIFFRLRVVEKFTGMRRFALRSLGTWIVSYIVESAITSVFYAYGKNIWLLPGPLGLIGGLASAYYHYIPASYYLEFGDNIRVSDKALTYFAILQTATSTGQWIKLVSGIIGQAITSKILT